MIHVGVFGYGTVGSGVVEVLTKNEKVIEKNVGEKVKVKAILDLREFPGDPILIQPPWLIEKKTELKCLLRGHTVI